jgi:endonuclease/exonuclease/phosphatase family metal-dependent hydrolase
VGGLGTLREFARPIVIAATVPFVVACSTAGDDANGSGSVDGVGSTFGSDDGGTTGDEGGGDELRVATWNVENLGLDDPQDLAFARDVVLRLDADVLCLQEVLDDEGSLFASFLTELYPHRIQGDVGDLLGGPQTVACLSKRELLGADSISASEASTDPNAADIGREFVWVRVPVGEDDGVSLVSVHLKAGQDGVDQFRRAVESIRLRKWVEKLRVLHPGEPIVLLGDFNVRPDDDALGASFADFPPGLPSSFELGADITLPVVYDPLDDVDADGFSRVDATLAGTSDTSTHRPTLWRLDYVFVAPGDAAQPSVTGSLVYDACRDDETPPLPLTGAPLPCLTTETASDHWPVVVELVF